MLAPTIVKILLTLKMQSYLYRSILHSRNMAKETPFQSLINWLISTGYASQLSMKMIAFCIYSSLTDSQLCLESRLQKMKIGMYLENGSWQLIQAILN